MLLLLHNFVVAFTFTDSDRQICLVDDLDLAKLNDDPGFVDHCLLSISKTNANTSKSSLILYYSTQNPKQCKIVHTNSLLSSQAVKTFQSDRLLNSDGIVGDDTWQYMLSECLNWPNASFGFDQSHFQVCL